MKTDEGTFSSSEPNIRCTCSGHSLSGRFSQAGPVSHSLLLSSSMLIALVPMSAWLLIPLTCFHYETSVVSSISATRLATNTCCLRWELCIHCSTWKVFFSSQEFCFFTRLQFVVPILSILSPDAFQLSSHVNTERSEQSDRVEY